MEQKKSKEANLENKKASFFFIGLILTSATIGMAFQYEQFDADEKIEQASNSGLEEELVYEPILEEPVQEEPETTTPPPVIEEIDIVPDDDPIDEIDFDFIDEEITELPIEDDEHEIAAEPIVLFAPVAPAFPGGDGAMMEWIKNEIEYPQTAVELGEQGKVYVEFVVNRDGSIEQVKVVRGVSDSLDKEAKRVIKKMPKWSPGEQDGKKLRVRHTIPIFFRLG